ncbi:MAG: hypothetical protein ACK4GE_01410 [Caldimicrobium sp.]
MKQYNFQSVIDEVANEYGVSRDVICEVAEGIMRSGIMEFFGGIETDVFLRNGDLKVILFKEEEIVELGINDLKKGVIKGLIAKLRKDLRKKCEEEIIWGVYRKFKGKIKELVKGKVIHFNGSEYYVEFLDEFGKKFIGICNKADMPYSGRDRWREWKLKGEERYFGVKNVLVEDAFGFLRLKIMLTRQSKFVVEKLFRLFGYSGCIYEIKRVPYKVKVWVEERVPREVIRSVARELDEEVIVRYGR